MGLLPGQDHRHNRLDEKRKNGESRHTDTRLKIALSQRQSVFGRREDPLHGADGTCVAGRISMDTEVGARS